MAENKKSFIAYVDWKETFDALPNEKAGQLVKHLFAYVNDENPVSDDVLINAVFANIKQTLKRDLDKYELIIQRNRENGSKGGRPRSKNVKPRKPSGISRNPDKPNETQTNPEKHDSDNDSDNDSEYIKTWRDDFSIYMEECKKGYKEFLNNDGLLKTQQRLNPGINIKLSIEKGYTNFWGTEAGWSHKKKSKIKEINWTNTIINSISINKVYYTKVELERQS